MDQVASGTDLTCWGLFTRKATMAKAKAVSEADLLKGGNYKGYDIRWLKGIGEEHPDFALVAEYEALGKKKK